MTAAPHDLLEFMTRNRALLFKKYNISKMYKILTLNVLRCWIILRNEQMMKLFVQKYVWCDLNLNECVACRCVSQADARS